MSGETERDVSGWTTDTLKAYTDGRLRELLENREARLNDFRRHVDDIDAAQKQSLELNVAALRDHLDQADIAIKHELDRASLLEHDHVRTLIDLGSQKAETSTLALRNLMVGHHAMDEQRFLAQEKAILKAENSMIDRFSSVNEFRGTLQDQAATFLSRAEHSVLERQVDSLRVEFAAFTTGATAYERQASVERGQLDKRLENMNEFRSQLKDQAATFLTRNESVVIEASMRGEINRLNELVIKSVPRQENQAVHDRTDQRIKALEENRANLDGKMWAFGGIFTIANIVLSWWLSSSHVITR